jgi:hypothetical protein
MSVSLPVLGAASNGPLPGPRTRPNMLSVGDSLMWGQGLRPDHRFRELVRERLAMEVIPVVELSMARSGANLDPANPQNDSTNRLDDKAIADTLLQSSTPAPLYAPSGFAREVPHDSLTTAKQLEVARDLLRLGPDSSPDDIRWIILDGGINDINAMNIVSPAGALADGEVLEGWSAWLLDRARTEVEPEMVTTLARALQHFPNAVIVVNGYFPIFSLASMYNLTQVLSFGVLYSGLAAAIANPASMIEIAEASRVWQVVSNEHLRRAIRQVVRQFPGRTVVFARSNIEGAHCLFGPDTWLWGYSNPPAVIPKDLNEWMQWFAGANPEDEVIADRFARCAALSSGFEGYKCRLASIGHPNLAGAIDYATAIIEALEDGGVIASDLDACSLQHRRRIKSCIEEQDARDYACVANNASMQKACGRLLSGLVDTAKNQAKQVGGDLGRAKDHMTAAGDCIKNTLGTLAQSAKDQFSAAASNLANAATRFDEVLNCWRDGADELRRCEDAEARGVAACDADYNRTANGPCNIVCNSFGNCNSYSRFNPYRYVCRGLRATCVAAAAAARGICLGVALGVRELCRATAHTKGAICKGGVVLGDAVCSAGKGAAALGNVLAAGTRAGLGLASAGAAMADGVSCAAGEAGRAGIDVGIAGGRVGVAVAWDFGVVGVYGLCRSGQWFIDKMCRLDSIGANALCRVGSGVAYGACLAGSIMQWRRVRGN